MTRRKGLKATVRRVTKIGQSKDRPIKRVTKIGQSKCALQSPSGHPSAKEVVLQSVIEFRWSRVLNIQLPFGDLILDLVRAWDLNRGVRRGFLWIWLVQGKFKWETMMTKKWKCVTLLEVEVKEEVYVDCVDLLLHPAGGGCSYHDAALWHQDPWPTWVIRRWEGILRICSQLSSCLFYVYCIYMYIYIIHYMGDQWSWLIELLKVMCGWKSVQVCYWRSSVKMFNRNSNSLSELSEAELVPVFGRYRQGEAGVDRAPGGK